MEAIIRVTHCEYNFETQKTTKRELTGEELKQWIKENIGETQDNAPEGEEAE